MGRHIEAFQPRLCSALTGTPAQPPPGPPPGPPPEPPPEPEPEPEPERIPPTASLTLEAECDGDYCRVRTGIPVALADTTSGTVSSREWEFGDGATSRAAAPRHAWDSPGFYTVELTVTDGENPSIASQVVLVEAAEPAGTCEPTPSPVALGTHATPSASTGFRPRMRVRARWCTPARTIPECSGSSIRTTGRS